MFRIPGEQPAQWEMFKSLIENLGDIRFHAIEQKRSEDCSVPPGPDNDVVVAAAWVIGMDMLITVLKRSRMGDWPEGVTGSVLGGLIEAVPSRALVDLIVESQDTFAAMECCSDNTALNREPEEFTHLIQWQNFVKSIVRKGIALNVREFHEKADVWQVSTLPQTWVVVLSLRGGSLTTPDSAGSRAQRDNRHSFGYVAALPRIAALRAVVRCSQVPRLGQTK
jgi:hypothetical protein